MRGKIFSAAVGALITAAVLLAECAAHEPLSLWSDHAAAKTARIDCIRAVTAEDSPDYIPVGNRIAVFDFDGTPFPETDPTCFGWPLFERRVLEDPNYKATEEPPTAKLNNIRVFLDEGEWNRRISNDLLKAFYAAALDNGRIPPCLFRSHPAGHGLMMGVRTRIRCDIADFMLESPE